MENYKINIPGLSKVRWTDSGKFKSGNKTILFSGRQDDIHHGGVAVILDKDANSALTEWTPVNEQLITTIFVTSHAKVTVMPRSPLVSAIHHPTTTMTEEDLVDNIPHHDVIIVMCDMNVQVGGDWSGFEHVLGPRAFGKRTENGNCLVQFCAMNNLMIGSDPHSLSTKTYTRTMNNLMIGSDPHSLSTKTYTRTMNNLMIGSDPHSLSTKTYTRTMNNLMIGSDPHSLSTKTYTR